MSTKLIFFSFLIVVSQSKNASEWRSRSVYQLLTDRFSPSNFNYTLCSETPITENSVRHYCGGTYRGIIDQLDYIVELGFDAIWISPIPSNTDVETVYGVGWHGYWQDNIFELNKHFGSEQDLIDFVEEAHKRGIWVMLDVVANHVGPNVTMDYVPFDKEEYFHHPLCFIEDFNDQHQVEFCSIGSPNSILPDLNTEHEFVISTFNSWINSTVKKFNFDAIRIDTFRHIGKPFWKDYDAISGVFSIGEVASENTSYVASYQTVADALLHYPLFFVLSQAFRDDDQNRRPMSDVEKQVQENKQYFSDSTVCGTFLDNHDQDRFLNHTQDPTRIQNALTYLLFSDGIPILYMGTEQNFTGNPLERYGAADPWNRDPLWRSSYDRTNWIYKFISNLNRIRADLKRQYSDQFFSSLQTTIFVDRDSYVYQKGPLIVMVSNQPFTTAKRFRINSTIDGFQLRDLVSNETFISNRNGEFEINDWKPHLWVIVPPASAGINTKISTSLFLFICLFSKLFV